MNFQLSIAGVPIGVEHRYPYIKNLCRDYLTDREPLFSVSVTEGQIKAERRLTQEEFSPDICECTCLHREITRQLVQYDIFLIHSAVVAVDGVAYPFLAKSGVGKSTHIKLWQQVFGPRAVVVNGDKPMFSFVDGRLMAHGSPWRGKEGLGENLSLPVGGICLLERGLTNTIRPATQAEVVDKLFHQVLLPIDAADSARFMGLLGRVLTEVPFYKLACNMDPEAALVAWRGMRKDTDR